MAQCLLSAELRYSPSQQTKAVAVTLPPTTSISFFFPINAITVCDFALSPHRRQPRWEQRPLLAPPQFRGVPPRVPGPTPTSLPSTPLPLWCPFRFHRLQAPLLTSSPVLRDGR